MIYSSDLPFTKNPVIKVVGVGGGGGNAINRMVDNEVKGVTFVAINTDNQVLRDSKADIRVQIGKKLTRGLGAGADPEVGRNAAIEDREAIRNALLDTDLVFITAGMGGGTGTGAAPIVAEVAKEMGILTIAIVTKPFAFEGPKRMQVALQGANNLKGHVDALILIPNEKLLSIADNKTTMLDSFREADTVLRQGVQGIAEIITYHGLVNVDFADVRTIMENKGTALLGIGAASGENRAVEAARKAIHSQLLEISLDGATDAIVNITSSDEITLFEVNKCLEEIHHACSGNLNVIYGSAINRRLKDEMVVTIVATGYDMKAKDAGIDDLTTAIFQDLHAQEQTRITPEGLQKVENPSFSEINSTMKATAPEVKEVVEDNSKKEESYTTNVPDWLRKKYQ